MSNVRGTEFAVVVSMHLEQLVPFFSILIILILAVVLKGVLRSGSGGERAYEGNARLFTPADCLLLGVLEQILGKDYRIIGKVRIADFIRPLKGLSQSGHTSALNRIISKHIDFAVCDPKTMQVLGVIQHSDRLVDAALSSAGIPLVRLPAQRAYTPAEIRLRVSGLFATTNPSFWRIQPRLSAPAVIAKSVDLVSTP